MIALKDELPLVRFASGEIVAFRREWLLRSLAFAARRAGYERWWLAEHVAESITTYLRLSWKENVVPLPRLEKAVRSALQAIGFSEVASRFESEPPFAHIDLPSIAAKAGHGYELLFFDMLASDLGEAVRSGGNYVELNGLATCVKTLRSKKIWSAGCVALRDEIVLFARHCIETLRPGRDIVFTLT